MGRWLLREDISMNDKRVLLFAGTTEGHQIVRAYGIHQKPLLVCVATDYGRLTLEEDCDLQQWPWIEIHVGRLDYGKMEELLKQEEPLEILDATHPYAQIVSRQIVELTTQYNIKYTRIVREEKDINFLDSKVIYVSSIEEAAGEINQIQGSILLTTGSKDIGTLLKMVNNKDSVYARVLPSIESIDLCLQSGVKQQHIIGMQGPFSTQMNEALIRQLEIQGMVTKASGSTGGFYEKYEACKQTGIPLIVIGRPVVEEGITCTEYLKGIFQDKCEVSKGKTISLVGIGTGRWNGITEYAKEELEQAQVIFGAKRMLEFCRDKQFRGILIPIYQPDAIQNYLRDHGEIRRAAVALSGDVGFYSGARKMRGGFLDYNVKLIPGISIVEAIAARFSISWEDMKLVSCHGNQTNPIPYILKNHKCLFLLGSKDQFVQMVKDCIYYHLEQVQIYVALNLDSQNEVVRKGQPVDFLEFNEEGLFTVVVENENYSNHMNLDLPDESFMRKDAPMTKREIRTLSIVKLDLSPDSVVIDVGTGTGSVGIGCAKIAYEGMVYGIEKEAAHLDLLMDNQRLHQVPNFVPVIGDGVDIIPTLPRATHGFVGGSSGKMEEILDLLYANNPCMKIVINGITLETVASVLEYGKKKNKKVQCVEVFVASTKQLSSYHMLQGNNPIFILSLEPEVEE